MLEIALDYAGRVPDHKVVRIRSIKLKVGRMRDIVDEYMQQYFLHVSRGTVAEGAHLDIERIPIVFACDACAIEYEVGFQDIGKAKCPGCGENKARIISGREFSVEGIEVVCNGRN